MDPIINALRVPFTTVPPKDRPSDKVIVAVWAGVGFLLASAFR